MKTRKRNAALFLLVIGLCVQLGCDYATIWSAEVRSPDGLWFATASTIQDGGPGTAYVGTDVYLRQASKSRGTVVLSLENDSAYPPGSTAIRMVWLDNRHLELYYGANATVEFQAVKCFGLDISARVKP